MRMTAYLAALAVTAASLPALAEPVQKDELGELIREYILENPSVITESMQLMQQREQEKRLEEGRKQVKLNKDKLFDDKAAPSIGPDDADIHIVEFSDYNCSACKYMFNSLNQLVTEGKVDAKIYFREFPIFGEPSEELSRIALAVNVLDESKYFDFHGKLMTIQGRPTAEQVNTALTELDFSPVKVREEAKKDKYGEMLQANTELGRTIGASGTPTLVIGDELVPHALDYNGLLEKIEANKGDS